jgi:hypothetical protein
MLDVFGWIVWVAVLIVAGMLTYGLSHARTVTRGTLFLIFALWIELAAFLLKPEWSKLHLLWVVVATFVFMTFYSYSLGWHASRSVDGE